MVKIIETFVDLLFLRTDRLKAMPFFEEKYGGLNFTNFDVTLLKHLFSRSTYFILTWKCYFP